MKANDFLASLMMVISLSMAARRFDTKSSSVSTSRIEPNARSTAADPLAISLTIASKALE